MGFDNGIGQASEIFSDAPDYSEDIEQDIDTGEEAEDVEDEDVEDGEADEADAADDEGDAEADAPESDTYTPDDYVGAITQFASQQFGLTDEQGNEVPQGAFYTDMAQRYEAQLKVQKLENDIHKLSKQDEDFNEVAPTFAQTVLDMPELLQFDNGAAVVYEIAKAKYIQQILPDIIEEIVQERTKAVAEKQAFQTKKKSGGASAGSDDITAGIMAEANRRAKLI